MRKPKVEKNSIFRRAWKKTIFQQYNSQHQTVRSFRFYSALHGGWLPSKRYSAISFSWYWSLAADNPPGGSVAGQGPVTGVLEFSQLDHGVTDTHLRVPLCSEAASLRECQHHAPPWTHFCTLRLHVQYSLKMWALFSSSGRFPQAAGKYSQDKHFLFPTFHLGDVKHIIFKQPTWNFHPMIYFPASTAMPDGVDNVWSQEAALILSRSGWRRYRCRLSVTRVRGRTLALIIGVIRTRRLGNK